MFRLPILFLNLITLASCSETNVTSSNFTPITISFPTHKLVSFSIIKNTKYLIVFETGLGDDHLIWNQKNLPALSYIKTSCLVLIVAGKFF